MEPTVVIQVEGGIAHIMRKPAGIRVIIRDVDEWSIDPLIETITEASEVILT